jgi:ABC-type sugar transport system permease subunit
MDKWPDNRAWFLVLPVFVVVAFSAIIPLMTVVNYSIQDIFGPGNAVFVGTEWFREDVDRQTPSRCPGTPVPFLGSGAVDRNSTGDTDRSGHAQKRLGRFRQPGDAGHPPADSMECDRHHLDHLHPTGYRLVRRRYQQSRPARHTLRSYRPPILCMVHPDGHGGVALDTSGRAALLCRTACHSGGLLSSRKN